VGRSVNKFHNRPVLRRFVRFRNSRSFLQTLKGSNSNFGSLRAYSSKELKIEGGNSGADAMLCSNMSVILLGGAEKEKTGAIVE
jgi:hypothetical protein